MQFPSYSFLAIYRVLSHHGLDLVENKVSLLGKIPKFQNLLLLQREEESWVLNLWKGILKTIIFLYITCIKTNIFDTKDVDSCDSTRGSIACVLYVVIV